MWTTERPRNVSAVRLFPVKKPDCIPDPYPWAIEEGFDAYRTLMETKGEVIGITSGKLAIVLTGDSAYVATFHISITMLT